MSFPSICCARSGRALRLQRCRAGASSQGDAAAVLLYRFYRGSTSARCEPPKSTTPPSPPRILRPHPPFASVPGFVLSVGLVLLFQNLLKAVYESRSLPLALGHEKACADSDPVSGSSGTTTVQVMISSSWQCRQPRQGLKATRGKRKNHIIPSPTTNIDEDDRKRHS